MGLIAAFFTLLFCGIYFLYKFVDEIGVSEIGSCLGTVGRVLVVPAIFFVPWGIIMASEPEFESAAPVLIMTAILLTIQGIAIYLYLKWDSKWAAKKNSEFFDRKFKEYELEEELKRQQKELEEQEQQPKK